MNFSSAAAPAAPSTWESPPAAEGLDDLAAAVMRMTRIVLPNNAQAKRLRPSQRT